MQQDAHALWHSVLGEVELSVPAPSYTVYWSNLKLTHFDENEAV